MDGRKLILSDEPFVIVGVEMVEFGGFRVPLFHVETDANETSFLEWLASMEGYGQVRH